MAKKAKSTAKLITNILISILLIGIVRAQTIDTSGAPIAVIILLPMILGLFFIISAFVLDPEEHAVLRLFLILLSQMTFFLSSWQAMQTIVKFYNFPEMQDSIALSVYVFGIMIFVIIAYFMIYAFYKGVHAAAQKKREMMLQ